MTPETQPDAFDDSPEGQQRRWAVEIPHARKQLDKFYREGEEALRAYMDVRDARTENSEETHWTVFTSNVQTKEDMLLGNTPKVSVSRRFADARDDVARVAGVMLERILNADIEKDGSTFATMLLLATKDRLVPGLGQARVRYQAEFEEPPQEAEAAQEAQPAQVDEAGNVLAPPVPLVPRKTYECAETDFIHWRDYLWSVDSRVQSELRWVAFRNELSRKALVKRFGEAGKLAPLNAKRTATDAETRQETPWARCEVWEIWDRESETVFWWTEGMPRVLDSKPNPLGLSGFFPCPLPMLATYSTSSLVPRNDYALARDLYAEVNEFSTRIKLLTDALRVAGVYDKSAGMDLSQLLDGSTRNTLIPVDRWAAFAEKGGLRGSMEFMPLEAVVGTIAALSEQRRSSMDALFQLTGMSDVVRGQQTANGTPGEAAVKARFASVRMQRLQDEVARFASELQRLKAEIIAKHFSPESIVAQSNVMATPDAPLAMQAATLIQSDFARYRIEVKPESLSLTDFAQLREERTALLTAIGSFLAATAPIAQQMPGAQPYLLQTLQWFLGGFRGASEIEGVLDAAIAAAQQAAAQAAANPQQPPPDSKLQVQQLKGAQDMQKIQAETRSRLVELQAEVQADAQREANQRQENVREAAQKQALTAIGRMGMPPRGNGGLP